MLRRDRASAGYLRVRPPVAFEMLRDSPDLLILDLRSREAFRGSLGHLNHARNVPLDELPWRLGELTGWRHDTFLVYCDGSDCGPTGMAVLVSSGFDNAVLMEGGIEAWLDAGYGTVALSTPPPPALPEPIQPPPNQEVERPARVRASVPSPHGRASIAAARP